jgi:hypothetical protein
MRSDARVQAPEGESTGLIPAGAVLTLAEFMHRTGWGRAALRRARRNGLRVVRDGRTVFVLADEFNRYLRDLMERMTNGDGK